MDACSIGSPSDSRVRADEADDRFGPFRYVGGRLTVEDLLLDDLAHDLAGQAAWVLSRAAVEEVFVGVTRCLPVGLVGPSEVLSLAAAAGWWAAVVSSHELDLAERAGFSPGRISAPACWRDDGFVKDALTRGVASLPAVDESDEQNIERIAGLLGVRRPGQVDVPESVGLDAFSGCGGLLSPVLRGAPAVVLDSLVDVLAGAQTPGAVVDVLPLVATGKPVDDGILTGLSACGPKPNDAPTLPARLHGAPARGDWVVIPSLKAAACTPPDTAHRLPTRVLVYDGLWRPLEQRPLPPAGE